MARRRPALLALAAIALAACAAERPPEPEIDATSLRHPPAGDVVGFRSAYGSHAWRGIPYAKPPTGERRWRAPEPAERWSGTLEAVAPARICPQLATQLGGDTSVAAGTPVGDEDCLTLDVWAPVAPEPPSGLPVLVWIHGGGNVVGGARFYDGGRLAQQEGVVVVAVNYRLGPLGWFRQAALREGASPADASGNYGTLDLVRALAWVRDNVAAFGGDPGAVTIFGESAGARNVLSLLVAAPADGLFQRAIAQSGGLETTPPGDAERPLDATPPGERNSSSEVLLRLLVADGRAADRSAAAGVAASMSAAETAAYLRGRAPAELIAAYEKDANEGLADVPQLFRDGAVLPEEPIPQRLAHGASRVPLMIGTNRDENKLFLVFDRELATWWFGLLPRLRDPERYQVVAEHMSRWWKATAADGPARAITAAGAGPVFVYRFDWDEEPSLYGLADLSQLVGAAHGFEIPFVFGHWQLGPMTPRLFTPGNAEGREQLSAQMRSYWAEFARNGAPGRGGRGDLVEWTAWSDGSPDAPRVLVLDTEAGGGVRMDPHALTEEEVIAAIEADPRLHSQRDRCAVFYRLERFGRAFDEARYAGAGCAAFPIAAYPWVDVAAGG